MLVLRSGSGWYDLLMGALWLNPLLRSKAKEASGWLVDWHEAQACPPSSSLSSEHQKRGSFSSLVNGTTDGWMDGRTEWRLRWCLISPRNYASKDLTTLLRIVAVTIKSETKLFHHSDYFIQKHENTFTRFSWMLLIILASGDCIDPAEFLFSLIWK